MQPNQSLYIQLKDFFSSQEKLKYFKLVLKSPQIKSLHIHQNEMQA